jgi:uncharacterized protein YeeX (DUF496 family)
MSLKNIKKLIHEIQDSYEIDGISYKKQDILNFARKYDPTIATFHRAIAFVENARLFDRIKRELHDKDNSFTY